MSTKLFTVIKMLVSGPNLAGSNLNPPKDPDPIQKCCGEMIPPSRQRQSKVGVWMICLHTSYTHPVILYSTLFLSL